MTNRPPDNFAELVKAGKVAPDFRQGKTLLYKIETVEKIKKEFGR